jgi:hypothetical protein
MPSSSLPTPVSLSLSLPSYRIFLCSWHFITVLKTVLSTDFLFCKLSLMVRKHRVPVSQKWERELLRQKKEDSVSKGRNKSTPKIKFSQLHSFIWSWHQAISNNLALPFCTSYIPGLCKFAGRYMCGSRWLLVSVVNEVLVIIIFHL